MMRSGIPDSDSIWGLDTSAQLSSRTSAIGPVQFVGEIIGFDWDPRWVKKIKESFTTTFRQKITKRKKRLVKDANKFIVSTKIDDDISNYIPVTGSLVGNLDTTIKPEQQTPSNFPPAQYSSSAYTFLGILLWLFSDTGGKVKDWSEIDLNALLPLPLRSLINFAGTTGNNGSKYFSTNVLGNKYYSYEKTVSLGGVIHSEITTGSPIDIIQTGLEKNADGTTLNAGVYNRKIRGTKLPVPFVDWDASSGVSCGNCWGKCTSMAEIYMNILSPNAENSLIANEIQELFVNTFINYNGRNALELDKNKIRAPWCLGANAWSQEYTYNCGVMGPDWFYLYDYPLSYTNYGVIPCYGHLGATYGYCSCTLYFPSGILKPYTPLKNNSYAYSKQSWTNKFDFCGQNEFTISCVQNSCVSESKGPTQQFVTMVLNDPFKWD
jgi:hypothetical protein